eukprot:TRINITY_DN29597_c0_g1_i1.p4 TRINITY_DN29597_c0_g1~~TRINITY_DN29597_c0_g1_i1.p4  ORF type:complete len:101 (-),score=1.63 TRINITY_DN29597_c0_g1_i1:75-377(-)
MASVGRGHSALPRALALSGPAATAAVLTGPAAGSATTTLADKLPSGGEDVPPGRTTTTGVVCIGAEAATAETAGASKLLHETGATRNGAVAATGMPDTPW